MTQEEAVSGSELSVQTDVTQSRLPSAPRVAGLRELLEGGEVSPHLTCARTVGSCWGVLCSLPLFPLSSCSEATGSRGPEYPVCPRGPHPQLQLSASRPCCEAFLPAAESACF